MTRCRLLAPQALKLLIILDGQAVMRNGQSGQRAGGGEERTILPVTWGCLATDLPSDLEGERGGGQFCLSPLLARCPGSCGGGQFCLSPLDGLVEEVAEWPGRGGEVALIT